MADEPAGRSEGGFAGAASVAVLPCSDDFRHPDGTDVRMRRLPDLFFPPEALEVWGGPGAAVPPPPPARYPTSSPFRCHHCLLRFAGAPLFVPISVATRAAPGPASPPLLLVTVEGHYCCQACRVRGIEALPESVRLNVMRADLAMLGRVPDLSEAAPRPEELEPFGGPVPLSEFLALRARTALTPQDMEALAAAVPARVWLGARPRFARETFYGVLEGGAGPDATLQTLALRAVSAAAPAADPAPASRWHAEAEAWGMRFVQSSGPAPAACLCHWCAGEVGSGRRVQIPQDRDPTGTVTLRGAFCSTGCALSFLLFDFRFGVSPSAAAERLGIMAWLAVHRHGVRFGARLACAPHRLELAEFGGDLSRTEFDAIKACPDLHTVLETPPFCSARMAPNYTRPGVICDLSRVGSADAARSFDTGTFSGRFSRTHGLFDALVSET